MGEQKYAISFMTDMIKIPLLKMTLKTIKEELPIRIELILSVAKTDVLSFTLWEHIKLKKLFF